MDWTTLFSLVMCMVILPIMIILVYFSCTDCTDMPKAFTSLVNSISTKLGLKKSQTGGDESNSESSESEITNTNESSESDNSEILKLEKEKQKLELNKKKLELKKQNELISINNEFKKDELKSNELDCNSLYNVNDKQENFGLLNNNDCNLDYFPVDKDYLSNNNEKIKPNELLPKNMDMKGKNFLTSTLSVNNEDIIGKPTQIYRSRLNYDLRSMPPNPQIEVSPWNMSTMGPDTDRRHFEIGSPSNDLNNKLETETETESNTESN